MADEKDERDGGWSGVEAVANAAEAALVVGFLMNNDIPARVVDKSFHQTPTTDEDLSSVEIAVPTSRLQEARTMLARREEAFAAAPEGAETVLTDEGPADIDTSEEGDEKPRVG